MASLWGDGWFYISALGFAGSLALFVYFLGQYRAAVEAEEGTEEELPPAVAAAPGEKVYVPKAAAADYPEPVPVVKPLPASASASMPVVEELPKEAPRKEPAKKSESTSSGGLSPAVTYIQSLKLQVDSLEKELAQLKALASQQTAQGELILKKLASLAAPASHSAVDVKPEPVLEIKSAPDADASPKGVGDDALPRVEPEPVLEITPAPAEEKPAAEPVDDRSLSASETDAISAALASHAQAEPAPLPIELKLEQPPSLDGSPQARDSAPSSDSAPSADGDKTLIIEPSTRSIKSDATAELKIKPQAEPSPSEAPKPRKGPVWPI